MIYIVIPAFNRWSYTKECLLSLTKQTFHNFKTIVVDHGSTDATSESIKANFSEVILLHGNETMWWTAATNLGVQYALNNGASYILTLNNDLVVKNDYIQYLVDTSKACPNSIIGSVSVNINNEDIVTFAGVKWNQWTAKYIPSISMNLDYKQRDLIQTDLLPGRGTLIPAFIFKNIGLYDVKNFPHYMADEDFSLKAKKSGYELIVCAKALVYSHVEATGLNVSLKNNSTLQYLLKSFTSIKSPNNLSVRWNWSKNTNFPFLYFLLDFTRLFMSLCYKSLKKNLS